MTYFTIIITCVWFVAVEWLINQACFRCKWTSNFIKYKLFVDFLPLFMPVRILDLAFLIILFSPPYECYVNKLFIKFVLLTDFSWSTIISFWCWLNNPAPKFLIFLFTSAILGCFEWKACSHSLFKCTLVYQRQKWK